MLKSILILAVIVSILFLLGCDSKKEQVSAPVDPNFVLGDININGRAFEVADYVLFMVYFIYGEGVFTVNSQEQINNSDINLDSNVLTMEDLILLQRIVYGLEEPPKRVFDLTSLYSAYFIKKRERISVVTYEELGGVLLVIEGPAAPVLALPPPNYDHNIKLEYAYTGLDSSNETNAIIYIVEDNLRNIAIKSGELIYSYYDELVRASTASIEGVKVNSVIIDLDTLTTTFELYQNQPNPFEDLTTIRFAVFAWGPANIVITDRFRKPVFRLERNYSPSYYDIVWDGTDSTGRALPSGYYTVSLTMNGQTQSKRMYLSK